MFIVSKNASDKSLLATPIRDFPEIVISFALMFLLSPTLIPLSPTSIILILFRITLDPEKSIPSFPQYLKEVFSIIPIEKSLSKQSEKEFWNKEFLISILEFITFKLSSDLAFKKEASVIFT